MISGNKCGNCGKGIMYGHNVSHSKRRTKRIFKPNLHSARVEINGIMKRMKLCAKCMRLLKGRSTKDLKMKKESNVVPSEVPVTLVSAQV